MKSANTIRTCSATMMIVLILGSIGGGIFLATRDDDFIILMILIWIVGIFGAIMQNALFQGFADIIDNTYASACSVNGISNNPIEDNKNGSVSFQQPDKENEADKNNYIKYLLDNELISQEEYDQMIKEVHNIE